MDLTNSYDLLKLCNKICRKNNKCNECYLLDGDYCLYDCLKCGEDFDSNHKKLIEVLEQYNKDYPQKTYLQDFKEKFPNAKLLKNGVPDLCVSTYRKMLGLETIKCNPACKKCWNRVKDE